MELMRPSLTEQKLNQALCTSTPLMGSQVTDAQPHPECSRSLPQAESSQAPFWTSPREIGYTGSKDVILSFRIRNIYFTFDPIVSTELLKFWFPK